MNTRNQILLAAALVGLAGASVGLYAAVGTPSGGGDAMDGHNHAAMGGGGGTELTPVHLTADAAGRIGVTYATAERRTLVREVRAAGNVTYDETRLATVNPKIEGWVERLHVDFTGAPVRAGQPLMEVYSPMLVAAQEELILARRLVDQAAAGGSERASGTATELLESARRRLRYWDISAAEIARIESSGTPRRTLTLTAPASGVVVEKNVVQGMRIMPGMDLYRIADLGTVWVEGEVFEKDLSLVRLGQHAVITLEAYPGERFEGLVRYVYPTLDVQSRTGRVRLELKNPEGRIRPGMYASVALHLAVSRESVVVPRTAVLQTGERAIVFVHGDGDVLTPREVTVGLASGADVEIVAGLEAGEVVVSSAAFLIDAEANLGVGMQGMDGMGESGESVPATADPHAGH
jgi:Cu(I)/Ag(I) efflux system membrane fusion protein